MKKTFLEYYMNTQEPSQNGVYSTDMIIQQLANDVVTQVLSQSLKVRVYHLTTRNHAAHTSLQDLYEKIEDECDEILEKLIGMGAVIQENDINLQIKTSSVDLYDCMINLETTINMMIDTTNTTSLLSVNANLIEIQDAINSTKYFLRSLN
jgi:DNA-binding ferritin-like protein